MIGGGEAAWRSAPSGEALATPATGLPDLLPCGLEGIACRGGRGWGGESARAHRIRRLLAHALGGRGVKEARRTSHIACARSTRGAGAREGPGVSESCGVLVGLAPTSLLRPAVAPSCCVRLLQPAVASHRCGVAGHRRQPYSHPLAHTSTKTVDIGGCTPFRHSTLRKPKQRGVCAGRSCPPPHPYYTTLYTVAWYIIQHYIQSPGTWRRGSGRRSGSELSSSPPVFRYPKRCPVGSEPFEPRSGCSHSRLAWNNYKHMIIY